MDALVDDRVIPSHTHGVKFAISVPDELFAAVDARVEEMGISRSQFFADAAKAYLEQVALPERVAEINAILDEIGYYGPSDDELAGMQAAFRRTLSHPGMEWDDGEQ